MKKLLIYGLLMFALFGCDVTNIRPLDDRDIFVGQFTVEQTSLVYDRSRVYAIGISKSEIYRNYVNIDNFYGFGLRVSAKINKIDGHLSIPVQYVGGYLIQGNGWLNRDGYSFDYSVDYVEHNLNINDDLVAFAWDVN